MASSSAGQLTEGRRNRLTLRFADPALEQGFLEQYGRVSGPSLRFGIAVGLALWLRTLFVLWLPTLGIGAHLFGYMVAGGAPEPREDHAVAVAPTGLEMLAAVWVWSKTNGTEVSLRVGVHSGPVGAGVIGKEKFVYDL